MEKVTIGFFGGALSLRVSSEQLDALLKALPAGGWHDLEAEDGTVRVNLASSSTSAPTATSTASGSASERSATWISPCLRLRAHRRPHAGGRARGRRVLARSASTARCGWRSARPGAALDRAAPRRLAARRARSSRRRTGSTPR